MELQQFSHFFSKSLDETIRYGKELAQSFVGGEIIFLIGDLGSGKTCLTKGIALGLGIDDVITSPSFTLMNIYHGQTLTLYHIDFYRLNNKKDFFDFDVNEYISPESVVIMEWGENLINDIPFSYLTINIDIMNDTERRITLSKQKMKY